MGIKEKGLIVASVWLHVTVFAKPVLTATTKPTKREAAAAQEASSKEEHNQQPWYVDTTRPLLTAEEKKKICRQYEGHHISYYKDVYRVKGCKRILLSDAASYELTRQQIKIDRIDDSKVIEALPTETEPPKLSIDSLCKLYRNHYITNSVGYYHLDANCVKHEFPNWDTFDVHRKSHTSIGSLQVLDSDIVSFFKEGSPIASMADKLSTLKKDIPILRLPLETACKGLIGRYMSYRNKMYYIQARKKGNGCEKVEKEGDVITRKQPGIRIEELSHSEAYSIPDAKEPQ
jgi:hypothetical protein